MSPATASWVSEAVNRAVEAFNEGEFEAVVELCDPDIEFTTFLTHFQGRTYGGHDGMREWFASIQEVFSSFHLTVRSIKELPDLAIVEVTFSAIGGESGVPLSEHLYQRIEFRNRLALSWSWHPTRDTALGPGERA